MYELYEQNGQTFVTQTLRHPVATFTNRADAEMFLQVIQEREAREEKEDTAEDIKHAIARVRNGEKLSEVAAAIGMPWRRLRSYYAISASQKCPSWLKNGHA